MRTIGAAGLANAVVCVAMTALSFSGRQIPGWAFVAPAIVAGVVFITTSLWERWGPFRDLDGDELRFVMLGGGVPLPVRSTACAAALYLLIATAIGVSHGGGRRDLPVRIGDQYGYASNGRIIDAVSPELFDRYHRMSALAVSSIVGLISLLGGLALMSMAALATERDRRSTELHALRAARPTVPSQVPALKVDEWSRMRAAERDGHPLP